jgi:hypothetical protein
MGFATPKRRSDVIGLLVGSALLFVALLTIGVLVGAFSLVFWALTLPFRLLGLAFRAIGLLLALPLLLPIGIVLLALAGVGLFLALLPALPVVLLVALIWWLARGGRKAATA